MPSNSTDWHGVGDAAGELGFTARTGRMGHPASLKPAYLTEHAMGNADGREILLSEQII
jgi:hypothetical protein